MYMLLRNISPEVHGLIKQHQAKNGYKSLDETIEAIVQLAMVDFPKQIKVIDDQMNKRLKFHKNELKNQSE